MKQPITLGEVLSGSRETKIRTAIVQSVDGDKAYVVSPGSNRGFYVSVGGAVTQGQSVEVEITGNTRKVLGFSSLTPTTSQTVNTISSVRSGGATIDLSWNSISGVPGSFSPSPHSSSHSTGSADPILPGNIGAASLVDLSDHISSSTAHPIYLKLSGGTMTGQLTTQNLIPDGNEQWNIGSFNSTYKDLYAARTHATVFVESTAQLFGGWLIVPKDVGSFTGSSGVTTTVNFAQDMTVGDIVIVKGKDTGGTFQTEYMRVASLISGTTYNAIRDARLTDGTHDFPAGTPFSVAGHAGDGRVEIQSYDSPRISMIQLNDTGIMGGMPWIPGTVSEAEYFRAGDLNGIAGYTTTTQGLFIGDSSNYLKYADGALSISGTIIAGGGEVVIGENGINIGRPTSFAENNSIKFGNTGGASYIYSPSNYGTNYLIAHVDEAIGPHGPSAHFVIDAYDGLMCWNGSSIWSGYSNIEGKSAILHEYLKMYSTAGGFYTLSLPPSFNTTLDLVLPDGAGTSGQVIKTDGVGTMSWTDMNRVGSPPYPINDFHVYGAATTMIIESSTTNPALRLALNAVPGAADTTVGAIVTGVNVSGSFTGGARMRFVSHEAWTIGANTGNYIALDTTPLGGTAQVTKEVVGRRRIVTNNSATAVASFTIANSSSIGGVIRYTVEVTNGTDYQVETGEVTFHCNNKAGAFSGNSTTKFGNIQAMTSGTLTVTWTITAANPAVLTVNCNSSLTPSAGYPRVNYTLENLTGQAVALS